MRRLVISTLRISSVLACAGTALSARAVPGPGPEPLPAHAESKAEEPAATTAGAAPASKPASWTDHFTLGGGIALYYYQPTNGWDNQFLIYSSLRFDAHWQPFGLHFEPRMSNEKMRSYYDGLAWIQEAYLYFEHDFLKLKVGKVYKQVGLFWDNSFYGNIQVYEGLKFDPNAGASLEGKLGKRLGLAFWAQYFVVDGHTNASLGGRDTISIPGARRRNTAAARVAPFVRLSRNSRLELGLSGEHFTADLPEAKHSVWRVAGDVKLTAGGLGFWGEVLHQAGQNVDGFPYPAEPSAKPPRAGRASADNTYLLAGVEYTLGPVVARYDLSVARYADASVEEVLHLPGIGVTFHENTSFLAEYAFWQRYAPEGSSQVDRSLNLTWMGHF